MNQSKAKEIVLALKSLMADRQVPPQILEKALEAGLRAAYQKEMNATKGQQVDVQFDLEKGDFRILAEKEVVEDVQNPGTEVLLAEARKINPDVQLGDTIMVDVTPESFGRVAAQTARQVIQQNIREAEREMQAEHFRSQISEMISGVVQARTRQGYTIGLDMRAEGLLPDHEKIPGESFQILQRIRAVVVDVKAEKRAPRIILSRTSKTFLLRLLENEVPEIYRGLVEVRAIAREPGKRAKVAVSSNQPGLDPVGACVGQRGVRIQAIVDELRGEKIDVIEWSPDPIEFIKKALSPAVVTGVYVQLNADRPTATVIVSDDQLSLAIGRSGQNARLAAKLTGWRIDIKSISEAASETLALLQKDAGLQARLPIAVEEMPEVESILAEYAETQHLTLEQQVKLAQFIDRVEKGRQHLHEEAEQLREAERANMPAHLFEKPLSDLDVPEYVFNIISEDEYVSLGDFLLTYQADPDRILRKPGIGEKARGYIKDAVERLLAASAETVTDQPQTGEEDTSSELVAGEVALEEDTEAVSESVVSEETEDKGEDASLEDVFNFFRVDDAEQRADDEDEGSEDESGKKTKKKKKKKKGEYLVFDEELGQTVKRRKRKRGGGDFEDDFDMDW